MTYKPPRNSDRMIHDAQTKEAMDRNAVATPLMKIVPSSAVGDAIESDLAVTADPAPARQYRRATPTVARSLGYSLHLLKVICKVLGNRMILARARERDIQLPQTV